MTTVKRYRFPLWTWGGGAALAVALLWTVPVSAQEAEPETTYPAFVEFALNACGGPPRTEGRVILVGIVRDSVSGVRLVGATARARWTEPGRSLNHTAISITNPAGYYAFCSAPVGEEVSVQTSVLGRESRRVALRLTEMGVQKQDIVVALGDENMLGGMIGRVVDQENGMPVDGAVVRIIDTDLQTLSNHNGRFLSREVESGRYALEIEHIAYGTQRYPVEVPFGGAAQVEITVSQTPIELEPIVVEVRSRAWLSTMSGFYQRMDRGLGVFLTPEYIEQRAPTTLTDALRGLAGVRVVKQPGPGNNYGVLLRGSIRFDGTGISTCPPILYIDGVRVQDYPLDELYGGDLAAVEVYRGASELPAQFAGSDAGCGVVVVWTRR
jgi:hypothetical protein